MCVITIDFVEIAFCVLIALMCIITIDFVVIAFCVWIALMCVITIDFAVIAFFLLPVFGELRSLDHNIFRCNINLEKKVLMRIFHLFCETGDAIPASSCCDRLQKHFWDLEQNRTKNLAVKTYLLVRSMFKMVVDVLSSTIMEKVSTFLLVLDVSHRPRQHLGPTPEKKRIFNS